MTTNCYATLAEAKADLGITDTTDDARLKAVLEDASRAIDLYCRRRFSVETRTRYYTARHGDLLEVDDLLALTTCKHDEDGDRTYETTWAATDYDLTPFNAPYEQPAAPYTAIEATPSGVYAFPTNPKGVQVVGSWGYYQYLSALDTLGAAITTTSATTLTATSGTLWSAGMTVLIGSEQMHVQSVATNTVTVTRGANGTTAATALNGAAVQVYTYPGINIATRLLIARYFKRRDTPEGVMGSPALGVIRVSEREDSDAIRMLAPFVKYGLWGVG